MIYYTKLILIQFNLYITEIFTCNYGFFFYYKTYSKQTILVTNITIIIFILIYDLF